MGYDVHITRAFAWDANEGLEIPAGEWLAAIADDAELYADPGNGPLAVRFGARGWFDWFEGNVFTTEPDAATMKKAFDLARRLSAIVQGDDGETYDSAVHWSRHRAALRGGPEGQA